MRRLSPRQLTNLVAEHALRDRLFAAQLLAEAGLLDPADHTGLHDARAALRDASNATTGSRWQISDVEAAGQPLAAEISDVGASLGCFVQPLSSPLGGGHFGCGFQPVYGRGVAAAAPPSGVSR